MDINEFINKLYSILLENGYNNDDGIYKKYITKQEPGQTIIINGVQQTQPGRSMQIEYHIDITKSSIETADVEDDEEEFALVMVSVMIEGMLEVIDVINFYIDESELFNGYIKQFN